MPAYERKNGKNSYLLLLNTKAIWQRKHLKKEYSIVYKFKDKEKSNEIAEKLYRSNLNLTGEQILKISLMLGYTEMIEYDSISFGKMNQNKFEEFIKNQLPYIYENIIGKFFEGEIYDNIIRTIEEEYKKFFSKLH